MANKRGGKTLNARYKPYGKGGKSAAREGLRYAQHRPENGQEQNENRVIFDREGEVDRSEVLDRKDAFVASVKEGRQAYEYSLVLNPGEGRTAVDLEQYTRDAMDRVIQLRADNGARVEWAAVTHRNQSDHDHVHIYMTTDKTISRAELTTMQGSEVTGKTWSDAVDLARQERAAQQQSQPRELPADKEVTRIHEAAKLPPQDTRSLSRAWHEEQHGGREK